MHLLIPFAIKTFEDYANLITLSLGHVQQRQHMNSARKKTRYRNPEEGHKSYPTPRQVEGFFAQCRKQTRIITFLSEKVAGTKFLPEKEVTCSHNVLVNGSDHSMPNCNHEEANTGMFFFHLKDALEHGSASCLVAQLIPMLWSFWVASFTSSRIGIIWLIYGWLLARKITIWTST